jgi:hypothetical protein
MVDCARNCYDYQHVREYFDGNGARKRQQKGDDVEGKQYSQIILSMSIQDSIWQCYEWRKRDVTVESWPKKMKQNMREIVMAYIWHNHHENANKFGTFLKGVCSDI